MGSRFVLCFLQLLLHQLETVVQFLANSVLSRIEPSSLLLHEFLLEGFLLLLVLGSNFLLRSVFYLLLKLHFVELGLDIT